MQKPGELVEIAEHVGTSIACVYIRGDRFMREIGVAEAALTKPPNVIRQLELRNIPWNPLYPTFLRNINFLRALY